MARLRAQRRGAAGQDHDARAGLEGRHRQPADRASPATRGTRRAPRVVPAAARGGRGVRAWARWRSAPTAAARSASRRLHRHCSAQADLRPGPAYPASPFGTLAHAGPMARSVDRRGAPARRAGQAGRARLAALPAAAGALAARLDAEWPACASRSAPTSATSASTRRSPGWSRAAAGRFAELGAQVEEVDPGFADPRETFDALWFAGAAHASHTSRRPARAARPGAGGDRRAGPRADRTGLPARERAADRLGVPMGRFHERVRPAAHPDDADHRVRGRARGADRAPPTRAGRAGRRSAIRST